jgi:hypothetical protein
MAVSIPASAAPVVLEWVQTSSGTATYGPPLLSEITVSSAPITNGRIVLADESLLSQNISVSANSRLGVAATFKPSILEISGTTLKDFNTFTFDLVMQELLGSQCSYLVDPAPSTSGGIGKNRWCEASVNLVKGKSILRYCFYCEQLEYRFNNRQYIHLTFRELTSTRYRFLYYSWWWLGLSCNNSN